MSYRVVPLKAGFLNKARNAGLDDQGQAIEVSRAIGGEPCRDVLRAAKPREPIILASYCPFLKPGPYKEYGPIYILAQASSEPVSLTKLPTAEESGYLSNVFVLKAYCKDERIIGAQLVNQKDAEQVLKVFFADKKVDFVLARYAAYGCYSFRVERATAK